MPLGEVIAELGLQVVLEFVFYGITYWTGFVILKGITLGRARLAPFSAMGNKNRGRWVDWSLFLNTSAGRILKMESVCLAGALFWIFAGLLVFMILRFEP